MALSNVITSSMTAREIVTTALELTGHVEPNGAADPDHAATGLKHLNWQLKTWQTLGVCDGWRRLDLEITVPAATKSVTSATNYLDLDNVRYRDSDDQDMPLVPLSLSDYAALSDQEAVGIPSSYNIRKTRTGLVLSLWPVCADAITIACDASRVVYDVNDLAQDVDIPQEWTECCFYALAARLVVPLQLTASDPVRAAEIKERAGTLFAQLKAFDEETGSVFFSPE